MNVPYITIDEAIKVLHVSDKTIRRHIAAGKIASKRASDGRILVQVDSASYDTTPSLEERLARLESRVDILEEQAEPGPRNRKKQAEQSPRIARIAREMKQAQIARDNEPRWP
jgi:excisionase family DNA binding protein